MTKSSLTVKAPGKLMIAGEFAVLEPHQKLAVMAVDRFVYANISLCEHSQLTLENFGLYDMPWDLKDGKVVVSPASENVRFVASAMSVALQYLQETNTEWKNFHLSVRSELDDQASGKKYGLGSSAAVSVSVIQAILQQFLQKQPGAALVFKLAAISHARTQGNGSGADVAASAYGGIIAYASFQAYWLRDAYREADSLLALLEMDWPYLSLEPVKLPSNIHVCIGWTGSPASTASLVDRVLQLKIDRPYDFQRFLGESERAVAQFMYGLVENNTEKLFAGVTLNRLALKQVGSDAGVSIETPLLSKLCDLAEDLGGAGKPSGAGGGDCGIAFMPTKVSAEQLKAAWQKAGIQTLNIKVCPSGTTTF